MLANYLKIAIRTLLKFREYTAINLLGLGFGIATGIFILLYVTDELSFDRFHHNADRVYRVGTDIADMKTGAITATIETNGWPVGMLLREEYPEVEAVAYIRNGAMFPPMFNGKRQEERIFFASADLFKLFDFPFREGSPDMALAQPNSVVITETMAKKYFGGQPALNKIMEFADTLAFRVTGVLKDVPPQSHMQFDMLVSFDTYRTLDRDFTYDDGWGNLNVRNYVLLKEGVNKEAFFAKARNLYLDHVQAELGKYGMYLYLGFEPLKDVYLKSTRGNGMGPSGSMDRVYLVSGIALFVILLACINFINLTTARSTYRAREVGLRKVVGSSRAALVRQFLSESLIMVVASLALALVWVALFAPTFNDLMGKNYGLAALLQPHFIGGMVVLLVAITVLSGYYPAIVLSGLKPAEVLKGKLHTGTRGAHLRRALVAFQFMISTGLIVFTLVIDRQLRFMKDRDLGFNGDQVLVVNVSKLPSIEFIKPAGFKNALKGLSDVDKVTFTNALPGKPGWVGQWARAEEKPADETIGMEYMSIDEDYLETLGLKLVAGHNFDELRPSEQEDGLIINETAVHALGWDSPAGAIGKKISSPSQYPAGTVIGVVKDYNEFGLQKEVYPMAMDYAPRFSTYFAIKYNASNTESLLENISALWKDFYEGYDFEYFFLDENFAKQYRSEQRLSRVFNIFSTGSILIAVIGLFGLVSFMVTTRTKEIGVRKVLGASTFGVLRLLTREFVWLVLIANAIAFPVVWYTAHWWLEGFAYRAPLGWMLFAIPLMAALAITVLTVGIQALKAAMADPVKSLRYE
ncbi:MAG: ABC transporter permease [Cyclobacteriaceae bacterium]|nr:ABC transporter permease [Cyclobacteriaceae bacterium]MCB0500777.1 ABC transporter permease [Cyclobacteriaceae bacterium]MCO5272609.1 ABC transporter permease [Cyclobacteriaceae bacterium]